MASELKADLKKVSLDTVHQLCRFMLAKSGKITDETEVLRLFEAHKGREDKLYQSLCTETGEKCELSSMPSFNTSITLVCMLQCFGMNDSYL